MNRASAARYPGFAVLDFLVLIVPALLCKGYLLHLSAGGFSLARLAAVSSRDVFWLSALALLGLGLQRFLPRARWPARLVGCLGLATLALYLLNVPFFPEVGRYVSHGYLRYVGSNPAALLQAKTAITLVVGTAAAVWAAFGLLPRLRARRPRNYWEPTTLLIVTAAAGIAAVRPPSAADAPLAPQPLVYFVGNLFRQSTPSTTIAHPGAVTTADDGTLPYLGRPNVVVVILESTSARYALADEAGAPVSPFLRQLTESGLAYDNARTNSADSLGSFAPLFLSNYWIADHYARRMYKQLPIPSWPQILKHEGYRAAFFTAGRFDYRSSDDIIRNMGFDELRQAKDYFEFEPDRWNFDEGVVASDAVRWAEEHGDQPYLLALWTSGPHWPYDDRHTKNTFGRDDVFHQYLNLTRHQDGVLQNLVEGIQAIEADRETLFLITADHGISISAARGGPGHDGERLLYEEVWRVPLVLLHPHFERTPTRIDTTTQLIDIGPILLTLLGLPIPDSFQGRPVGIGSTDRPAYAWSRDWQIGVVDGQLKLLLDQINGRTELYDLANDPEERIDLGARVEHSELLDRLNHFRLKQNRRWKTNFREVPSVRRRWQPK